jgi:hypothetical protein
VSYAREALAADRRQPPAEATEVAGAEYKLANLLSGKGKFAEAEALFAEARDALRRAGPKGHVALLLALRDSGRVAGARGRFADAESLSREADGIALAQWSKDPRGLAFFLEEYGGAIADATKYDDSAAAFEQARSSGCSWRWRATRRAARPRRARRSSGPGGGWPRSTWPTPATPTRG